VHNHVAAVGDRPLNQLYKFAFAISIFTILYNVAEGLVSTYLGYEDASLTLFGFGADSFIEALSGFGIAHMVARIQHNAGERRDDFERTALRITGTSFYVLVAGLTITSVYNIATNHQPQTTLWGVIISLISISVMWALIVAKRKLGTQLHSEAILADARCTKICIYMSFVLLASSAIYELTHLPYIDSIGTLGLAYFSYQEGKECFAKAKSDALCAH
jgi:divalent metal cation (Fe/Co/Zn/Cd) transporter